MWAQTGSFLMGVIEWIRGSESEMIEGIFTFLVGSRKEKRMNKVEIGRFFQT